MDIYRFHFYTVLHRKLCLTNSIALDERAMDYFRLSHSPSLDLDRQSDR